jgi:uncharacterized membrane protein YeaQ/YmgE (transglycosylase-associated protein family)
MHILWTALIGFVVGLLARALKPGDDKMGIIMTTLLGIGGAFLASYAGRQMGWYRLGQPAGFLASVGGAIIILIVYAIILRATARKD